MVLAYFTEPHYDELHFTQARSDQQDLSDLMWQRELAALYSLASGKVCNSPIGQY